MVVSTHTLALYFLVPSVENPHGAVAVAPAALVAAGHTVVPVFVRDSGLPLGHVHHVLLPSQHLPHLLLLCRLLHLLPNLHPLYTRR